ncbi:MAG: hypothetical protein IK130_05080 [Oscillospiraceae bacterium]|nr:hypothetical protein [Oscillospiraceae bacterium]
MKRKLYLILTMLCMILLTACEPAYSMEIKVLNLPDQAAVSLYLKQPDGESYMQYEPDHNFGDSAAFHGGSFELRFDSNDAQRWFCEEYRFLKVRINDSESQPLLLVPEDKYGYPKHITYDAGTDTFTVSLWLCKSILGQDPTELILTLLFVGLAFTGLAAIITIILGISSALSKERAPWKIIWITSLLLCSPYIVMTVMMMVGATVPYFNMSGNIVSFDTISEILWISSPWILYLFILWLIWKVKGKKRKKSL